jgi:hypothetical protein
MDVRKGNIWFAIIASVGASSATATDNEAESRRLFAETTWGGVYTCSAAEERLRPENAEAAQMVLQAMEREFAIPKVHGQSFRKLASAKVDSLSSEGRLEKFAADSCRHAKVGYIATGKE